MIHFDFETLRRIGLTQDVVNRLGALSSHEGAALLRVVEVQREEFALHDGVALHPARVLPWLLRALQDEETPVAIGDWVVARPDAGGALWIEARIDPVTEIARRANDGRRQAIANNVDTALLAMGLDADFNPRRMERTIAMVRACGVVPVVVLTKRDLGEDAERKTAQLCRRLPATVPVIAVNALSGQASAELQPWLASGRTLVLLGSSGAGKSTLTNALAGAHQPTGGVRTGDGRGRHTTTARSLHLCAEGACIIDTPGLRTWRPDADSDALAAAFEDVEGLAAYCRFRDCRHDGEPGCAVRTRVDADRLLNFRKLVRDAERGNRTPLDGIALRRKWKAIGKAGGDRARAKRVDG